MTTAPDTWLSIAASVEALNGGLTRKTWSEHKLRHYVRHAQHNGLAAAGAIRRLGRTILINPARFVAWIESRPTTMDEAA